LNIRRVVDLSQDLYPGVPAWQTSPDLKYEPMKRAARDLSNVTIITQMHMHIGTHVDTPLHSLEEGKTIDSYPIDRYMGEGIVLDLRHKKPTEEITLEDLVVHEKSIREGDVVLLCTDWSKKRGFNRDYLYRWPYLGISGSNFLIKKKAKAVGTEGMSIAGWNSTSVKAQRPVTKYSADAIHSLLLENDVLIIEGLSNLSVVLGNDRTKRAYFIFAPINFKDVEAAPCRAMAILEEEET